MPEINSSSLTAAFQVLQRVGEDAYLHSWSEIVADPVPIEALYIQNFGAIKLPPTLEHVESVVNKEASLVDSCRIDASKLTIIPSESVLQSIHKQSCRALENMLNIDFANLRPNFRPTLDALVVCQNGQSYRKTLTYHRELGGFATLILQLPLEDSRPSGRLVVRDGLQQVKADELAKNGENKSYMALLAGACFDRLQDYCLQSDGTVVSLIFTLVWNDFFGVSRHFSAYCYPELLKAANNIAKALSPWQKGQTSTAQDERFLCIPIIGISRNHRRMVTTQDLSKMDLALWRSAADINFVDVNFACISINFQSALDGESDWFTINQLLSMENPPEIRFSSGSFSPSSMSDNLFIRSLSLTDNIVATPWCSDVFQELTDLPVLVIRARTLNASDAPSSVERISALLESMENCLATHRTEYWRDDASLLQMLDCIVDSFANLDGGTNSEPAACLECLLFRALNVCTFLKAPSQGFAILESISKLTEFFKTLSAECYCDGVSDEEDNSKDISEDYSADESENVNEDHSADDSEYDENYVSCKCCVDATFNGITNFLKFACYSAGGANKIYPSSEFEKLIMDNICQENCYDYGEFGILLYYEGCVEEARFIFDRIVHTMAEHSVPLVTLDGDDLLGTEFIDLVSHFHNEGAVHDETFNKLLELARNVSALELRHLVEHLGESMNRLDCIALVRKLGQQILEREFAQFTSEDFLRIVWVLYELKERELLTSIWEKVCSERIEEQCLFGRILLETWPDFAKRDEALKTVCYASNASNQALDSSLEIVRRTPGIITDCWIYSVCLLNDALSDETRTKSILTEILPSYNNSRLSDIAWYIFTSTSGVLNQHSAIRQVFENALERISTTDLDLCSLFKTFRMLAWFGDLELLRNRYEELVNERNSTLVHLILSSFKNKHRRAASELGFNRDVFNLMLVKCVDNVEALQYGRANYFTRCCRLFAEAERNFIDSSEKNVAPAFSRLVQRLSSLEAAKVLKVLCVREVNNSDEPSLKKFPPCWQVFKELSAKAVEHLRTFELNRFPTRDVVSLMHCFFYVGEQEPLDKFQRLVCEMCKVEGSNADRAIFKHRNTLPLALAYPPGIVALNELIDARIQRLSVLHSKQSIALVYYRKEMSRLQSLRRTIVLRLTRSRAN